MRQSKDTAGTMMVPAIKFHAPQSNVKMPPNDSEARDGPIYLLGRPMRPGAFWGARSNKKENG
jgi:hypothetical protein